MLLKYHEIDAVSIDIDKHFYGVGEILSMSLTGLPGQIALAGRKRVTIWNYEETKMVGKYEYFPSDKKFNYDGILSVLLPDNFLDTGDVFVTVLDRHKMNNLVRISVHEKCVHQIFKHVTVGTQHIGDNNNSLVTIANHKVRGFKNTTVLCYDRNLSKVQGYNTDRERPFTITRCHPEEKTVACGDSSGRILIFSGIENRDELKASKIILHWHSLPVTALSWSMEGGHIYSGGGERVICKWFINNIKPTFIPRLESEVVGIQVSVTNAAVKLSNNSVLLLDRQDLTCGQLSGLSRSKSGWPAGLIWDSRAKALLLNGNVGHMQVFNPDSQDSFSIDLVQQNYITEERNKKPYNAEVELMDITTCGMYLATMDCCWAPVERLNLKFWHYQPSLQKFVLNTYVDGPHSSAVKLLKFQTATVDETPKLVTCGNDKRAKVWALDSATWLCIYSLDFRGLDCGTGAWSADGSVLGLSFAHLVTLWNKRATLKTTLTFDSNTKSPVLCMEFGKGYFEKKYLCASNEDNLCVWDLLTLSKVFFIPLTMNVVNLVADEVSGHIAVICKETISVFDMNEKRQVAKFDGLNATGGAVYATFRDRRQLFFLTFDGHIKAIGSKANPVPVRKTTLTEKPVNPLFVAKSAGKKAKEVTAEVVKPMTEDLDNILSVPLHALPSNSLLAPTFLTNRILSLPKARLPAAESVLGPQTTDDKDLNKIHEVFGKQGESKKIEFNSYCKLLKMKNLE